MMMTMTFFIEFLLTSSLLNIAQTSGATAQTNDIERFPIDIYLFESFTVFSIAIVMAGAFIGAGVAMSIPLGNFVEKALNARERKDVEVASSDYLADLILGVAFAESIILSGALVSATIATLF